MIKVLSGRREEAMEKYWNKYFCYAMIRSYDRTWSNRRLRIGIGVAKRYGIEWSSARMRGG